MLSVCFDILVLVAVGSFTIGVAVKLGKASYKAGKKILGDVDKDND